MIKIICPVCNKKYKRLNSHIFKANDDKHINFLKEQENLIITLFDNLNFNSKINLYDFNVFLNYSQCSKIWIKNFGQDKYKQRINTINSIHVSKALSGKPLSEQHKQALRESHKGQTAWNKGLTCKTDERILNYTIKRNKTMSKILKEKYAKGEMTAYLSGKSIASNPELISMYKKISLSMSKKEQYNSRGFAGIRNDIGHFAASTYEANVYRIFQYENKKYKKEYDCIFPLIKEDGSTLHYRIDIQDIDGLFGIKNTFLEIKGFMDEKSKLKIKLFKEQYPQYTLLTLGYGDNRKDYYWQPDINYQLLSDKYSKLIPLWETKEKNIKTCPELYKNNDFLKE